MSKVPLIILIGLFVKPFWLAYAHKTDIGSCPIFPPMASFDFEQFKGRWYAVEKFDTDGLCLTYDFVSGSNSGDSGAVCPGQGCIFQHWLIGSLKTLFNMRRGFTARGMITKSIYDEPADMTVKFNTNLLNKPSSFVVLKTDYDTSALICTCQSIGLYITRVSRKSCTILLRSPTYDSKAVGELKDFLDKLTTIKPRDPKWSNMFDRINHDKCKYPPKPDLEGQTIDEGLVAFDQNKAPSELNEAEWIGLGEDYKVNEVWV